MICTLKDGSSTEQVPAVRANHPTVGIAVFPLSRIELGDVWFGRSKTDRWDIKPLPGGWDRAFLRFGELIKYPRQFLRPTLEVLQNQTCLDKTPLSWTQWSFLCKNTSRKLFAVVECRLCGTPRCLSMRLLNSVNKTLDDFQCSTSGAVCGQAGKQIYDSYEEPTTVEHIGGNNITSHSTFHFHTAPDHKEETTQSEDDRREGSMPRPNRHKPKSLSFDTSRARRRARSSHYPSASPESPFLQSMTIAPGRKSRRSTRVMATREGIALAIVQTQTTSAISLPIL